MRYHGGCRNAAQWVDLRYHSHCLPPRHLRGIPLGVRALLLSTLSKAAYFASRFFLIVCNPRPPCFKQVGTPFRATFRHRCPVQRAIASHRRLLARPRLNPDCILEAFQAALPDPGVLPPIFRAPVCQYGFRDKGCVPNGVRNRVRLRNRIGNDCAGLIGQPGISRLASQ